MSNNSNTSSIGKLDVSEVLEKIQESLERGTLDYKWYTRNYLFNSKDTDSLQTRLLRSIANSAFDSAHYATPDRSLSVVLSLCADPEKMLDVRSGDENVHFLSELFNKIIGSDRKLHKCYDCGTTARATFLALVQEYRGSLELSDEEKNRMSHMYKPKPGDTTHTLEMLNSLRETLNLNLNNVLCICSVGLKKGSGHVWILEKRNGVVRMYQSALRSHLLIDFIEEMDYFNSTRGLDTDILTGELETILRSKDWTEIKDLWHQLFAYHPKSVDKDPTIQPSFCYTYIEL